VVDIEVAQCERRAWQVLEDQVGGHGPSIVRQIFGAIGVDDSKPDHRVVEEAVRGENVQGNDVAPVEKLRKQSNSKQKGSKQIKGNGWLLVPDAWG